MKRQDVSFQLNQTPQQKRPPSLADVLAGVLLLTGLWGLAWQCLHPEPLLMALPAGVLTAAGLGAGLLLRWDKALHRYGVWAGLLVLLALGLALRSRVTGALAGLGNLAADWRFLTSGSYMPPYLDAGDVWWLLLPAGVAIGFLMGLLLRLRQRVWWMAALAAGILTLRLAGFVPGGWFFACAMAGALVGFARPAAAGRKTGRAVAGLLALVLLAGIVLEGLAAGTVQPSALGVSLDRAWHRLRYEDAANPLPEGQLAGAKLPSAGNEPALQVTAEHWTPMYLRGYVAGSYTGAGWQQLTAQSLSEEASLLYSLQSGYFFPARQLSAAFGGTEEENRVSVQVLGACRATAYLPYGAGSGTETVLEAGDLPGEGMTAPAARTYSTSVSPVEKSYLLQRQQLESGISDETYRQGEAFYRQWVYDRYLDVPQETYAALTEKFAPGQDLNTTQAKAKVLRFLRENMTYKEDVAVSGSGDIASALLTGDRQGNSTHYATLSVLLLRSCGIPARYVEGYVVTRQQAEALTDGATLTLTQRSAHAWAEYYLDGVGWLPFDATPGFEDTVTYELPSGGPPSENGGEPGYTNDDPTPPREDPDTPEDPVIEDPDTNLSGRVLIQNLLWVLLCLLVLAVAALAARTLLLRRKLRRGRLRFEDADGRIACRAMLGALYETLRAMQSQVAWTLPTAQRAAALETLLGRETARDLTALEQEIWFSAHELGPAQREKARQLLMDAEALWRRTTSPARRWKQRFLTCRMI